MITLPLNVPLQLLLTPVGSVGFTVMMMPLPFAPPGVNVPLPPFPVGSNSPMDPPIVPSLYATLLNDVVAEQLLAATDPLPSLYAQTRT